MKFQLNSLLERSSLKGFSLIELVMTIVVVAIISVPLSHFLVRHIESLFQSRDYTNATNLARFEMEKVNNMLYNNIVSDSFTGYEGYPYDLARDVSFKEGSAISAEGLKEIRVEVMRTGEVDVIISMVTYIADNVSFGP
jgi:prepilin-type N-terminal cleavage/methylation domain-containing protein